MNAYDISLLCVCTYQGLLSVCDAERGIESLRTFSVAEVTIIHQSTSAMAGHHIFNP